MTFIFYFSITSVTLRLHLTINAKYYSSTVYYFFFLCLCCNEKISIVSLIIQSLAGMLFMHHSKCQELACYVMTWVRVSIR